MYGVWHVLCLYHTVDYRARCGRLDGAGDFEWYEGVSA